jgi:hypothetical protein
MTADEFQDGMDLLIGVFNPYRWTQNSADAYFMTVRNMSHEDWMMVCKQASMNSEKMPLPKQLLEMNRNKPISIYTDVKDCDLCISGRRYYTFVSPKTGQHYERYGACSCEAGNKVAQHMTVIGGISKEEAQYETIRRRLIPYQAESTQDTYAEV